MMKKYSISIIVFFLILASSCRTLNEKIAKVQYRSFPEFRVQKKEWVRDFKKNGRYFCLECLTLEKFRMYRDSSFFFDNIRQYDTIYIIETLNNSNFYSMIWNSADTISLIQVYGETNIERTDERISKCKMKLLEQWDIEGIREKEKNASGVTNRSLIYVTRIIIKKNIYKINCIRFYDFYVYENGMYK